MSTREHIYCRCDNKLPCLRKRFTALCVCACACAIEPIAHFIQSHRHHLTTHSHTHTRLLARSLCRRARSVKAPSHTATASHARLRLRLREPPASVSVCVFSNYALCRNATTMSPSNTSTHICTYDVHTCAAPACGARAAELASI